MAKPEQRAEVYGMDYARAWAQQLNDRHSAWIGNQSDLAAAAVVKVTVLDFPPPSNYEQAAAWEALATTYRNEATLVLSNFKVARDRQRGRKDWQFLTPAEAHERRKALAAKHYWEQVLVIIKTAKKEFIAETKARNDEKVVKRGTEAYRIGKQLLFLVNQMLSREAELTSEELELLAQIEAFYEETRMSGGE